MKTIINTGHFTFSNLHFTGHWKILRSGVSLEIGSKIKFDWNWDIIIQPCEKNEQFVVYPEAVFKETHHDWAIIMDLTARAVQSKGSLLQKRPIFTFLLAQRQKLGHQSEFADKQ